MIRYLLIILISFSTHCFAESVSLSKDLKINMPEGYFFTKENMKEAYLRRYEALKFSNKEINEGWKLFNNQGFDLTENQYEIGSIKAKDFWDKEKTEDGRDKNTLLFLKIAQKNCYSKKGKKLKKCAEYYLRDHLKDNVWFTIWYSNNKSKKLEILSTLTDDQIASLSKKEIKLIRKLSAADIKWKSKNKYFKQKGYRKVRIMPDTRFYIEQRSIVTFPKIKKQDSFLWGETVTTAFIIPNGNRTLVIQSYCQRKSCEGIEDQMAKIIEPMFKIDPATESYNFASKIERENLIKNVGNGHRIYRAVKVLMFII